MQLVIGNKNYSSWSLRPWLLLTHMGIAFEEEQIWLFTENMQAQMQGKCPNAKVPVLIEQDHQVWDSLAICEYINEQYLANKGWPVDSAQRSLARSICAEMHAGFFAIRGEMPMNCRRAVGEITLSDQAKQEISRVIDIFESCLKQYKGNFLFGEFSICDAFYMPVIVRFTSYDIAVPNKVKSYMQHMLSLPAYQSWLKAARAETAVIAEEEV